MKKVAATLGFIILAIGVFVGGYSLHFLEKPQTQAALSFLPLSGGEVKQVTILSFGDMMLDRAIRKTIMREGADYPFIPLKDFLKGHDVVVVNAEGSFTTFPSKTMGSDKPLQFTLDPKTLSTIKDLGFTVLSQANNHTFDFGRAGLTQSRQFIKEQGLATFGDPLNATGTSYTTTVRGTKITFIGYHQFAYGLNNVIAEIKEAKATGSLVIVYPHWGTEYNQGIDQTQLERGHAFIDAGADIIVGAHPHVIEPIEIYNGGVIFYSLGNFVFDQWFSRATMEGLALHLSIDKEKITYTLHPLLMKTGQTSLIATERKGEILNALSKASLVSEDVASQISQGVFTVKRK